MAVKKLSAKTAAIMAYTPTLATIRLPSLLLLVMGGLITDCTTFHKKIMSTTRSGNTKSRRVSLVSIPRQKSRLLPAHSENIEDSSPRRILIKSGKNTSSKQTDSVRGITAVSELRTFLIKRIEELPLIKWL
jgi:hypothetical protein